MRGPSGWDRGRLLRICSTLGLAVVGILLIFTALRPSTPEPAPANPAADETNVAATPSPRPTTRPPPSSRPTPVAPHSGRPTDARVIRDRITGPVLPASDPVVVAIPRIGARSQLVRLGLDPRGELEVPQDPARAGWFTDGAAPGALGPAVIAGHVTWNGTPAVFYRLAGLRPGDQVMVSRADGRTAVFTVSRVARFPKSRFPTQAVYGAIDHAGLRLITCGGTYDAARHRYLDNVVVFANLTAVHRSRHR
jgi:hypothetical protein